MTTHTLRRLVLLAALSLAATGCDAGGRATHPVSGTVVLPGGDVSALAGQVVEVSHATDRDVRAHGVLDSQGRFTLETLDGGENRPGAPAGEYAVRVLPDPDEVPPQRGQKPRRPPVAPRYRDFATSKLTLTVPPAGDVTLALSTR